MILIFVILYGSAIYFLFNRYKKTLKKAESASLSGEKEMLFKLANKHKKQAIFAILYILVGAVGVIVSFSFLD